MWYFSACHKYYIALWTCYLYSWTVESCLFGVKAAVFVLSVLCVPHRNLWLISVCSQESRTCGWCRTRLQFLWGTLSFLGMLFCRCSITLIIWIEMFLQKGFGGSTFLRLYFILSLSFILTRYRFNWNIEQWEVCVTRNRQGLCVHECVLDAYNYYRCQAWDYL